MLGNKYAKQRDVSNQLQCDVTAGMLPNHLIAQLLLLQLMLLWQSGLLQMPATRLQMMLCNCMEGESQ